MLRKITAFLTAIAVMLLFAGCTNQSERDIKTESINSAEPGSTEVSETEKTSYDSDTSSTIEESNISTETKETESTQSDAGGATAGLLKYRLIYYSIPRPFADIVGSAKCDEWEEKYLERNDGNQGNADGMAMKAYIQHFNISREDFDKANLKWAKIIRDKFGSEPMMNPKDFANQETDEVFNGDIIYTFDDEIINEYYMGHPNEFYPYWYVDEFEKAVEEGYTPRTTDWIDVDQMEAEIIAKYGSVD